MICYSIAPTFCDKAAQNKPLTVIPVSCNIANLENVLLKIHTICIIEWPGDPTVRRTITFLAVLRCVWPEFYLLFGIQVKVIGSLYRCCRENLRNCHMGSRHAEEEKTQ